MTDSTEIENQKEQVNDLRAIENIVFEGGGVPALAYAGAAQVLEQHNIVGKRFAGTSSGAIAATLLACRASADEVRTALESMDMDAMFDSSYFPLTNAYRLWYYGGWAKGQQIELWFTKWVRKLCQGKDNITLLEARQMHETELVLTGTCLNSRKTEYFCADTHPNMPLVLAVMISTRYPGAFPMVTYDNKVWWDGGIGDNFPIHVFDQHRSDNTGSRTLESIIPPKDCKTRMPSAKTIGFKLVNSRPDCCKGNCAHTESTGGSHKCNGSVNNAFQAAKAMLSMILELSQKVHVHKMDWQRTVVIDVGEITAMDFDITDAQRAALIESGSAATQKFLESRNK